MNRHRPITAFWMLFFLFFATPAVTQEGTSDTMVEEEAERLTTPTSESEAVRPADEPGDPLPPIATGLPGIDLPTYRPPRSVLVREGAFLIERQGYVHELEGGGLIYVFDKDASGNAEPPMILLPSLRTMEMARVIGSQERAITFEVNGEVFVYKGRNYLLVDFFRVMRLDGNPVMDKEEEEPQGGEEKAEDTENADLSDQNLFPEQGAADGPSVEELLEEIERADKAEGEIFRPITNPNAEQRTQRTALREGEVITARRGVIERGEGASWSFIPNNDTPTEGEDVEDTPLTLLPCLNLQKMAQIAQVRGGEATFQVSGIATVHEGNNYLLPTSFLVDVDRGGDLLSAQ
ncbi:MAG: hypothetical protein AAGB34_10135 [Planctomycetota bacterium]